jgi:antitoxin HicB
MNGELKMEKNLKYYLELNYPVTITKDIDERKTIYVAEVPDLPGCGAQGETIEESLKNLENAKKLWLEVSIEKNLPINEPFAEDEFSGKILVRIPAKLHMILSSRAKNEEISLNQFIRRNLENNLMFEQIQTELKELRSEVKRLKEEIVLSSLSVYPNTTQSSRNIAIQPIETFTTAARWTSLEGGAIGTCVTGNETGLFVRR